MAKSALLISKRSTRNVFGWAERISFSNLFLVIFGTIVVLLFSFAIYYVWSWTVLLGQSFHLQKTVKPKKVDEKLKDHDRPDSLRNPEELSKNFASSTSICQQKISTPQPRDLDHNTENFCSRAQEKRTNELQRTSSEHWQQQRLEGHRPVPNTVSREHRTLRCKRSNPETQTTPQETHDHQQSKRQRVSNDQRKKHFYMDTGAAYHSTFDPSVLKSYPAHLNIKPPTLAIHGFGGSTMLVTGYGYIDGPGGNKLEHVLLLPDSTANLMCLGQLTRDYPVKVVFYEEKFWIEGLHNGERIGGGHRDDVNHYVVDSFQPDRLLIKK